MNQPTSSLKDFEFQKALGKGAFSIVYKVKRIRDNKIYALKKVKLNSLTTKEKELALNEVRILASIRSPYIIKYKEAFYDQDTECLCIVMEYASGGDLANQLTTHIKLRQHIDEKLIWNYANQILMGLKVLHDMKILHRDLKGANIFVSQDKQCIKLGDLNVSKLLKQNFAQTQAGTPYYTAPEIWSGKLYNEKCDVWSMGCVIYELVTFVPPFDGNSMQELKKKVMNGYYNSKFPSQYSSDLGKFIGKCLKVNDSVRSTVDGLLNDDLIKSRFPDENLQQNKNIKEEIHINNLNNQQGQLLDTIKFPFGNLKALNFKLPKPNYEEERPITSIDEQKKQLLKLQQQQAIQQQNQLNNHNNQFNNPNALHNRQRLLSANQEQVQLKKDKNLNQNEKENDYQIVPQAAQVKEYSEKFNNNKQRHYSNERVNLFQNNALNALGGVKLPNIQDQQNINNKLKKPPLGYGAGDKPPFVNIVGKNEYGYLHYKQYY